MSDSFFIVFILLTSTFLNGHLGTCRQTNVLQIGFQIRTVVVNITKTF